MSEPPSLSIQNIDVTFLKDASARPAAEYEAHIADQEAGLIGYDFDNN